MSFDWNDRNIQRAFVYGCFESKQLAETTIDMLEKHVTVDTLTVHDWYQEFKATEHSSERHGRLVERKVQKQGTKVVNNAGSISNSDYLADREIKREIEEDSETSQPELKKPRLCPTTDLSTSSALSQEMKEEVDNVEDFITASNTTKTMNLIPPSFIKVEVYEDCNISEIDIYLDVDSVTISKKLTDSSSIPPQEFLYKTEDPTQYSFIQRAVSEVKSIFNTPNLKLDKLHIQHNIDENGANQDKKTIFYKELQQMMAKLSEKLHLGFLDIEVKNPEELIGFLKTIHPAFLTQLEIWNGRESFDMSQVVLLEHWPKLESFFCGYFVNIPLSKLAHMSSVFGFITETTTNELKEYFRILKATSPVSLNLRMKHAFAHEAFEQADFSEVLRKHKFCGFHNVKEQQCYLLSDDSVIAVSSNGRGLSVRKEADSHRRYVKKCYCN